MAHEDQGSGIREVPFGKLHDETLGSKFARNVVKNSKYTLLNFLPLNIYGQLRKAANFYFLVISLLLFIGEYTPLYQESIAAYSTFLTLAMMMVASAIMEALDDYRRHVADAQMNSQAAHKVFSGAEVGVVAWSEVEVGDVLIVCGEQEFPCDLVPLACSGEEGLCYVSTANLDGETNLKLKAAITSTQAALCSGSLDADRCSEGTHSGGTSEVCIGNAPLDAPLLTRAAMRLDSIQGSVKAEAPRCSIHNFHGSVRLGDGADEALGSKQLLLRGTMLRNTAWCIGLVVYTGKDTRVVMNSRKAPMKLSNLERVINVSMLVILGAQAAMALISDVLFVSTASTYRGYWYLFPGGDSKGQLLWPQLEIICYWITFFGLYSNLMPISLYATIEICNATQAYFIKIDLEMYDKENDAPAMVRTTNLCQEIGQVEYVFSDKTGTLTQNVMELKRLSIQGDTYGKVSEDRGFNGAQALQAAKKKHPAKAESIAALLEVLAVSHTVVVTHDSAGKAHYEAESPDEDALVSATAELGWAFRGRAGQSMDIDVDVDGQITRHTYTVLALNAFTSARKRMSVVVQRDTGEYWILVKGADNVMLERASKVDSQLGAHLNEFAREGLRTLVIGRRKLEASEVAAWRQQYECAQCALEDRDGALAAAADRIEGRLELLGATAIEDKLQVSVGETIVRIRNAGMKLWVLTGDKLETARNIGYSTEVLSDNMKVHILDVSRDDKLADLVAKLEEMKTSNEYCENGGIVTALMVTGQALEMLLGTEYDSLFLQVSTHCSVVIACRVSPLQKAQMVKLVRTGVKPTPVTLAVGDGANDVPMIQEAQVGVGIIGREGRQAVNAADFAIAQFRFLQRLMLVHGRLNYRRACKFTLYTFWRNAVQVLLMFYYSFMSGYSGISLFEDKVRMTFNLVLSVPVVATGIFDRDVSDAMVIENAPLYETGRLGLDLNPRKMAETLLSAFVHSLVILCVLLLAFPGMDSHQAGDYYTFGTAVYTCLITGSNYRVAFLTATWNWLSVAAMAASFAMYALFLIVYGYWKSLGPPMYSVPKHMASNLPFWFCVIAVPLLEMVIDSFISYLWLEFRPAMKDLILERTRDGRLQKMTQEEIDKAPFVPSQHRFLSSFVFDHPDETPRDHAKIRNLDPTSGDTSILDTSLSGESTHLAQPPPIQACSNSLNSTATSTTSQTTPMLRLKTRSVTVNLNTSEEEHRPKDTLFAQQKLPSWQLELTRPKAAAVSLVSGIVLVILGAVSWSLSSSVKQVRIQYEGEAYSGPHGTLPEEIHRHQCLVGAGNQMSSCEFNVTVPKDMEPPIYVSYILEPFYQNYKNYETSVIHAEMQGKPINSASRKKCKDTKSHVDAAGQDIVPCGLRATSFFNDTFEFPGMAMDESGIAWESDVKRYDNPPNYGTGNTSWLYRRYPTISRERGVKDEHFAVWMRPGALPKVQKAYGRLTSPLRQGQALLVRINASFPAGSLKARKELVLTTRTPMGGRDHGLGIFFVVTGLASMSVSLFIGIVQLLCAREPGEPRPPWKKK